MGQRWGLVVFILLQLSLVSSLMHIVHVSLFFLLKRCTCMFKNTSNGLERWLSGSEHRLLALPELLSSVPSSHMVAHSHL